MPNKIITICHIWVYVCPKYSLFAISGPICVAIISLYGTVSDRFLWKINICCCKFFTVEGGIKNSENFTWVNNSHYTVFSLTLQCLLLLDMFYTWRHHHQWYLSRRWSRSWHYHLLDYTATCGSSHHWTKIYAGTPS